MDTKLLTLFLATWPVFVEAQISYNGGWYTQDFNSLQSGAVYTPYTNLPTGWIVHSTWHSGTYVWTTVTNGFSNNYGKYAFSLMPLDPDKSIGLVGSIGPAYLGVRFRNDTGATLTSFTLSYYAEQWRKGAVKSSDQRISFDYSRDSTNLESGTFMSATQLDMRSIHDGDGVDAAMNGNAAANRQYINATVSGISWLPGQDLWLRWSSARYSFNSAHALAIDDLVFRAVPELRLVPFAPGRYQAFWSTAHNNYQLQSATNLVTPDWVPVRATLFIEGSDFHVNFEATNTQRYFRLQMR